MRASVRPVFLAISLCLLVVACTATGATDGSDQPSEDRGGLESARVFESNDPLARACALEPEWLVRIYRGYGQRSEDLTFVHQKPNFPGAFGLPSHSGPWDYLQTVPLVFYGPEYIRAHGAPLTRAASTIDVYETVGWLEDVDLPERGGGLLGEVLKPDAPERPPKLVVTLVWDGVGRNVLDRWPDQWPALKRMEREGTSYLNATVGSSPSITPATHASLGTGSFPRVHGVPSINYRDRDGRVREAFQGRDPSLLELTTFADEIDLAYGNASRVGMLGFKSWHLPMMGHGLATPGGDADQLTLIGGEEGRLSGNPNFYSTPPYMDGFPGLKRFAAQLDRSDGKADGKWLGNSPLAMHDNPAWVRYAERVLVTTLEREGYGSDEVPDLFFTNFKISDIVGHQYTMDSPQMREVIKAQDNALRNLVGYLDREVRDYVVILTADHGHVPSAERTGAWPVGNGELVSDLDRHFDMTTGESLVDQSTSTGLFLNFDAMRQLEITGNDIAMFLNGYTIRENWRESELPRRYEERGDEQVFSAAFTRRQFPAIMRCAFGSDKPPAGVGG
ncbi:MAG: alkaline phosphatase family protein [Actinobacteria bacterium]|nr:alkaline phosphatase family protein [Actinomycetota bacterium]